MLARAFRNLPAYGDDESVRLIAPVRLSMAFPSPVLCFSYPSMKKPAWLDRRGAATDHAACACSLGACIAAMMPVAVFWMRSSDAARAQRTPRPSRKRLRVGVAKERAAARPAEKPIADANVNADARAQRSHALCAGGCSVAAGVHRRCCGPMLWRGGSMYRVACCYGREGSAGLHYSSSDAEAVASASSAAKCELSADLIRSSKSFRID